MKKNAGTINTLDMIILSIPLFILVVFFFTGGGVFANVRSFFSNTFGTEAVGNTVNLILSIFAIFFLTVIAYSAVRLLEIRKREHEHLHNEMERYKKEQAEKEAHQADVDQDTKNPQWKKVLEYLLSNNSSDWKLAIIEADTMLDALLESLGFKGEDLGERLKSTNLDDFRYLNQAWEAHRVRNDIAHQAGFEISSRESNRVIALYEDIFRGYDYL